LIIFDQERIVLYSKQVYKQQAILRPMNLHEYQGKALLSQFGVNVPKGIMVDTIHHAVEAAKNLHSQVNCDVWAVKAQIHAGGRGKGGGVKIARSYKEVEKFAGEILGMQLITPQTGPQGKTVRRLLIEENIYYDGPEKPEEFYFSILLNRSKGHLIVLYSPMGGMNIEEVAKETPELIFTEDIDPLTGLTGFQCRRIAFNLGLNGDSFKNMLKFSENAYKAYIGMDANMLEINPLFKAADGKILAADTKLTIDNNALFRHRIIDSLRDLSEEDPIETEASNFDLNYIKLSGNVGCMVNGAGLAMATMDIIKQSGGEPANFLDVGGAANAKRVEEALRIILKDPQVKAILVNIFGGIVRCDRVAHGIVDACKGIGEIKIPLIVRLQGTNADEAKDIIDRSGLRVHSAVYLKEAAELVGHILKS